MSASRTALITGGNRGLGRAVALSLAGEGIDIIFTYRSHHEDALQVSREVEDLGARAAALQLDTAAVVTFSSSLRQVLKDQFERSSLDILVNNAGFAGSAVLGNTDEGTLDGLFAVHVKGVYLLTQQLATAPEGQQCLLADGGRIINVSSGLTRFVSAPYAAYAAMKGAVEVLTRYWSQELGPRGISVNTIAPGPVATDFAGGYFRDSEQVQEVFTGMTALGRIAEAEDIGAAVASLVSPRHSVDHRPAH
ncbi:SDR family NAD(P)-dependent oxidoreductase [Nesterenkonia flava]|uniref:SDR family oxidoreductase n=1 Tax=Nesterenkonia flava TaxID=469799 RepID=A0ABU1FST4_9MICC|nr:SDR family oxidoreductase [Nesterenkonia flava]MDR5711725.1 SDR family oxidoreductase [Nesterenkonia flava]